jgi:hypothetical protein
MKHKLILGSVIVLSSLLLLFSSCTKDMEEVNAKADQSPALLNGCSSAQGEYISMISHRMGANPFFWRGGKHDNPAQVPGSSKQTFSGPNFDNQQFFAVTATGGTPQHIAANGAIGVNDGYIGVGESLVLTLSNCLISDYVMDGYDLVLHGGNNDKGVVQMWCDGTLRDEVFFQGHDNPATPGKGTQNFPVKFIAKGDAVCFSQVVIKMTTGRIAWIGYHMNTVNGNPDNDTYYQATRFHLKTRPVTPPPAGL